MVDDQLISAQLAQGQYQEVINICTTGLESEPHNSSLYWYLGLVSLLQGDETAAQSAWLQGLLLCAEDLEPIARTKLGQILTIAAEQQKACQHFELAWVIYRYIQEFELENLETLLNMAQLESQLNYPWELRQGTEAVIGSLTANPSIPSNPALILDTLRLLLLQSPLAQLTLEFASVCTNVALQHPSILPAIFSTFYETSIRVRCVENQCRIAVIYGELCLRLDNESYDNLKLMSYLYQSVSDYTKALVMARRADALSTSLLDQLFTKHPLLLALMSGGGAWAEVGQTVQDTQKLLQELCTSPPQEIPRNQLLHLPQLGFIFPHFQDAPQIDRPLLNQLGNLCHTYLIQQEFNRYSQYRSSWTNQKVGTTDRPLKIGYLSSCFRSHPVGFLARGLLLHHDCKHFQPHIYFIAYQSQIFDPIQYWYESRGFPVFKGEMDGLSIADQIHQDSIDILIDLDSITFPTEVLALKPAPIQATWLGFDASGWPSVDYFIVDPYVLPQDAQAYYSEKLWRLSQSYLAIDGFEIGIPTLYKEDLGIPTDAVVYFSSQRGNKRNPHLVRLQLKILNSVPNSFFLIKGKSDENTIKDLFFQIAAEEDVAPERLKFLPLVRSAEEHRANLQIADIVLDTYPYNGATTSLEALWMGIPLVTRVGEQFASRNSYTFLINAGVEEGIAWSDAEYVEWGIRLGRDKVLRERVMLKLKAARKTAPLWNAKQFTRQMEEAYRSMWRRFLDSSLP